jgi:MFS family permease
MASNYSGFFIILYSTKIVNDPSIAAIIMISQNLGGTLAAYPMGYLADRYNENILLALGISLVIAANLVYAFAYNYILIIIASFIWGIQLNTNQSLFATKIANATTKITRGTAFGIYYVLSGLMIFVANFLMGWAFDKISSALALQTSSLFALAALLLLVTVHKLKKI